MIYKVEIGHDVALDDLNAIVPQPRCEGVKSTRSYAASGAVYDQAPYVEFEFDILRSAGAYQTLLDQFGLGQDSAFCPVTVLVRDELYIEVRRNGIAVRPQIGSDASYRSFPRNIKILVKHLVAAA